jgi:hypothetical protein
VPVIIIIGRQVLPICRAHLGCAAIPHNVQAVNVALDVGREMDSWQTEQRRGLLLLSSAPGTSMNECREGGWSSGCAFLSWARTALETARLALPCWVCSQWWKWVRNLAMMARRRKRARRRMEMAAAGARIVV